MWWVTAGSVNRLPFLRPAPAGGITGDDTFTRSLAEHPDMGATATGHDPPITFYRLQGCPFCERVTRLLEAYDLAYRSRFVEPLHSRRDVVKRVAGVRTVPVIVDDTTGVTMAESANIVDYLEATYGDGAGGEPTTDAAAADGGGES